MILSGTIRIRPTPKQRPKLKRNGRAYNPQKTRDAQRHQAFLFRLISRQSDQSFPLSPKLPLEICMKFYTSGGVTDKPKTSVPDTDNLCKLTLDAIVDSGIIRCDSQVTKLVLEKYWAGKGEESKIVFSIAEHADFTASQPEQQRLAL